MFSETLRDWNFALGLRALAASAGCVPRFKSVQNVNDLGSCRSCSLLTSSDARVGAGPSEGEVDGPGKGSVRRSGTG